jgi:hypothetical protein
MTEHDIELAKQAGFVEKTKGSVFYNYVFASIPLTWQLSKFASLIRADKQGEYEAMKKDAERYQKLKRLSAQARTFKEFAISRYNGMEWEPFENGQLDLDKTLDKAMENNHD